MDLGKQVTVLCLRTHRGIHVQFKHACIYTSTHTYTHSHAIKLHTDAHGGPKQHTMCDTLHWNVHHIPPFPPVTRPIYTTHRHH